MIDESKCYEILGVTAGVSRQELKAAHRDLAKVWHPDRFAHDPRLQEKAQEKLKEINEAFDQLTSGKPKRRPVTPAASNAAWSHHPRRARHSQPTHWRLVFAALLIFVAVFFFTSRSLIRRNLQQAQDAVSSSTEQIPAVEIDDGQSGNRGGAGGNELRGGKKIGERGTPQNSDARQMTADANSVQPLATATVTIDQATGLLARRDCPTKRTMTYPRGSEPKQYCNIHMPLDPARTEGELRVKSAAKRMVSPDKW